MRDARGDAYDRLAEALDKASVRFLDLPHGAIDTEVGKLAWRKLGDTWRFCHAEGSSPWVDVATCSVRVRVQLAHSLAELHFVCTARVPEILATLDLAIIAADRFTREGP